MEFCRIAAVFDYVDFPWAHQVHCFLMLDGRRLVCLVGYNVRTRRQSVSTWHGDWWSVRAEHNLSGQYPLHLLVVAMNWRGVPPLRWHTFFWHRAQFYLYDMARQVPQLREVAAHGHGLWPGVGDITVIDFDRQWEVERDNVDTVVWL